MTLRAASLYMAIGLVFIAGLAVLMRLAWLAAIAVWALLMIAGAAALTWAVRGWNAHTDKSIAGHVEAALPPGRCDYCDGFTANRRKCNCDDECTFVPWCGAREGAAQ